MNDSQRQRIKDAATELHTALREATDVDTYKPNRDRVLVKPLIEPEYTGTLWIPEEKKWYRALVIACGPGVKTKDGRYSKPDVEPGDLIMIGAYIGEPLELDREEFRFIRAGDILGIFHE